jgi:hypothetical protein
MTNAGREEVRSYLAAGLTGVLSLLAPALEGGLLAEYVHDRGFVRS